MALPSGEATGLREVSQIMVDKIMAVRRDRCSGSIGRADPATLLTLGRLLAFVAGIADRACLPRLVRWAAADPPR